LRLLATARCHVPAQASASGSNVITTSRLHWIDRLRGVSVLAVIWLHYGGEKLQVGFWFQKYGLLGLPGVWLRNGQLGINLLFILSGFVLYLPFAAGCRHLDQWRDVRAFLGHRAQRLLPLYYFNCAIAFFLCTYPQSARAAITQVLFLLTATFNLSLAQFLPPANWVLWTMGVQIWFALAFVVIAYLIPRIGLLSVVIATLAICTGFRVAAFDVGQATHATHVVSDALSNGLWGRLDDFVAGILIAIWYARGAKPIFKDSPLSLLQVPAGLLLMTGTAILYDDYRVSFSFVVLGNTIFQAGVALVLCSVLSRPVRQATARLWLPLELVGMMCYSIYIWHGVVLVSVRARLLPLFAADLHGVKFQLVELGLYFIALAPVAWLSYRYIECGSVKSWRDLVPSMTARSMQGAPFQLTDSSNTSNSPAVHTRSA
jgi:peptidoglycan/LPS O-acetylase OafA/YrhL